MKTMKLTLMAGVLAALATTLSAETALVNVYIPFSFEAAGKTLPAGTYSINEPSNGGVVMLHGNQPDSSAMVLAINAGPTVGDKAGVTFTRKGGVAVLSTIEVPGGASYTLVQPDHKTAAAVRVALPRK